MLASDGDNDKIATITGNANVNESADFERAVSAIGYGMFNALLLFATLPIALTTAFDTTSTAFILASAECEFELTFFRKGVLIAFPYIAMTMTSFIWDYITPYTGMRPLFIVALLIDSILNIVGSGVHSYYVFLVIKFLSGILVGGPLTMVMTYLTEFHSTKYKPHFTTWAGFLFALTNILPAALGFTMLPLDWHIEIFGQSYNSWRMYLLICSIPSVIGLVTSTMLPDSPKYLMANGRSNEALNLFRRIYCINTKQSPDTFPIKALLVPQKTQLTRSVLEASLEKMRVSLYNTKLLMSTAYLPAFCFVSFLQFGSMLGFNTMRMWVPHMFIILNNFDAEHWMPVGKPLTMCEMMDRHVTIPARRYLNSSNFDDMCIKWKINAVVYQNSTIIATSAVIFPFLIGFVMSTKLRKQIIMLMAFLISVASSFGINWAQSPPYMLTLASAVIVTTRIAGNVVTTVNADVIPVPLRATSSSILTMIGNIATVVGNFIFSFLLGTDCVIAFLGLGSFFCACFCLSLFFPQPVRNSSKKQLEANITTKL